MRGGGDRGEDLLQLQWMGHGVRARACVTGVEEGDTDTEHTKQNAPYVRSMSALCPLYVRCMSAASRKGCRIWRFLLRCPPARFLRAFVPEELPEELPEE